VLLLTTLNSQYVHSNLALRYLAGVANQIEQTHQVMEFTINESLDHILRTIVRAQPEMLAFSCYIWNIEDTLRLAQNLKKVLPSVVIVAGGPEVSYDSVQLLQAHPSIDMVVRGEGEETFRELLLAWRDGRDGNGIAGLTWRQGDHIIENPDRDLVKDLNRIPLPYGPAPSIPDSRILYYETSRGCPFNCSYCLSSTIRGVRYFPLDRVRQEIMALVIEGVPQIKFVDRSFNCHPKRALELMRFLAELPGETNFHFEIVADALSNEVLELLASVKPGRFQFEIGVQSINPNTLEKINRRQDLTRLANNIRALMKRKNIHIHLDLIAGLPEEDYQSLGESFNWVYDLQPDYLQLGFLKLLKGTAIREEAPRWDYVYKEYPPYEVLANRWLSFSEMSRLKIIDDLLQRYYNSHVFDYTLAYSISRLFEGNAFRFYEKLADYFISQGLDGKPSKRERLYVIMADFLSQIDPKNSLSYTQLLMFDFVLNNRHLNVPLQLGRTTIEDQGARIKAYLREQDNLMEKPRGSLKPRIEVFPLDVLALAGIREPAAPQPWYAVLFSYGEEGTTVEYIDL
jgi:radical SAM superfamily enzyme YgiQ (UPF0313 family)